MGDPLPPQNSKPNSVPNTNTQPQMGNPVTKSIPIPTPKPNNVQVKPVVSTPTTISEQNIQPVVPTAHVPAKPITAPMVQPVAVTPNIQPVNKPVTPNVEPQPKPMVPVANVKQQPIPVNLPKPTPIVKDVVPNTNQVQVPKAAMPSPNSNTAEPVATNLNKPTLDSRKTNGGRKLGLILFFIILVVGSIGAFIFINQNSSNNNSTAYIPISDPASAPLTIKTYTSKLYDLTFEYSSIFGTAIGITSETTYTSENNAKCDTENISFTNDRDLSLTIYTGHCEGKTNGSPDYTKISSKDGKSFFIVITKLDQKLFPGRYTITAKGGIDKTNNFITELSGVQIDAIRVNAPSKYEEYIKDIIKSMTVDLSTLKSDKFDSQVSI